MRRTNCSPAASSSTASTRLHQVQVRAVHARLEGVHRAPGVAAHAAVALHASIIDKHVDDFFWVYMGGMDRLRGYTYYAIGGRKGAMLSATYRFPIIGGASTGRRRGSRSRTSTAACSTRSRVRGTSGNLPSDDTALGKDYYSTRRRRIASEHGIVLLLPDDGELHGGVRDRQGQNTSIRSSTCPVVEYNPQWRMYLNIGFGF